MKVTSVFGKTLKYWNDKTCRTIVSVGSTRSSKTFSALQLLLLVLTKEKDIMISCVGETFNKVRLTIMRDWVDILIMEGLEDRFDVNLSEHIWTYRQTNSKIEFVAFETESKARGHKCTHLLIDEANSLPYPIADALMVRTTNKIILTLNPSMQSWVETKIIPLNDTKRIHSTYKDNEFLSKEQIRAIEQHKDNEQWWKVFALGEYCGGVNNVYTNWRVATDDDDLDSKINNAEVRYFGMDFGYMSDPTTIIEIVKYGKRLYIKELLYKSHLLNEEISDRLKELNIKGNYKFVADSAEMKSIDTIRRQTNIVIQPSKKGADSIRYGISVLQEYEMIIDQKSVNLIHELNNYSWEKDRISGENTNSPIDKFNHALDSCRYIALNFLNNPTHSQSRLC